MTAVQFIPYIQSLKGYLKFVGLSFINKRLSCSMYIYPSLKMTENSIAWVFINLKGLI
jgi:hypothetical protein